MGDEELNKRDARVLHTLHVNSVVHLRIEPTSDYTELKMLGIAVAEGQDYRTDEVYLVACHDSDPYGATAGDVHESILFSLSPDEARSLGYALIAAAKRND